MSSISSLRHSNGLAVVTDTVDDFESVTITVLVKNGSRNENKQNSGISHFLEHMFFKGTFTRTAQNIAEECDMMGGYFNAYTSRTSTVFYAKVLKNDLTKAINIMSDIILNSTFVQEELEKERYVILQELCMMKDTPDDVVFDHFQAAAFKNQPLGSPILGTEDTIKSFTRKKLNQYFNDHYSTKNTIISVAGNFHQDNLMLLVDDKFKNFKSNSIKIYDKAHYTGGEIYIKKDLEQTHLLIGFEGVSYLHKSFFDLQILAIILGGGMSSRLFQTVREKKGLVYNISSFFNSYSDSGIFAIYSALDPKNINALIDLITDELLKVTHSITQKEIDRAKIQIRSNLLMSLESTILRSQRLCNNFAMFNRYVSNDEILQKINIVNLKSLQITAKKIFFNTRITIALLGKFNKIYSYNKIIDQLQY